LRSLVPHAAIPPTSTTSNRILVSVCNLSIAPLYPHMVPSAQ
jgi:hypothetical protein